jgi:hypothetical protein
MRRFGFITAVFALGLTLVLFTAPLKSALAQNDEEEAVEEELPPEEIVPTLPAPGGEREEGGPVAAPTPRVPAPPVAAPTPPPEVGKIEGGEAREGETRWNVSITGVVIMNYVFNESPDNFVVKYRWEVKGQANATTAVIRGDADINAEVEGPLSKWPTGECKLNVTIPKVPFELSFQKTNGEKGNLRLVFKKVINEDWQSSCSFTDAPGARFDTRGAPEMWLAKAMDRARPPLKDIIADVGTEETTTRFVISKETINDPPLGTIEMEGTGVVTIRPGGE